MGLPFCLPIKQSNRGQNPIPNSKPSHLLPHYQDSALQLSPSRVNTIDNDINLVGAAKQSKKFPDERETGCDIALRQTNWKIIPPGLIRFGEIWDRMDQDCK